MADIASVVDGYIAVFNETDAERRRALIAETFTDDATYLDPLMSGDGRDGIDAMVAGVHHQFPGHRFELVQGPDATTTACGSRGGCSDPRAQWAPAWTSARSRATAACGR